MNNERKYYIMNNKYQAMAISYILGRKIFVVNDKFDENKVLYSFLDDEKFREVLTKVTKIRNEYNEYKNR